MKVHIDHYPEFLDAVKNNRLVYVFGAGISSALTGILYGWYRWILDGIRNLRDRDTADILKKELDQDGSAENMIQVVGRLLKSAKAEGSYHEWMREAFETNGITDTALAETIRKMRVRQDVLVTTNYDLLLEKASGMQTVTYEEPDQIFAMLDQGRSTQVIHIHGAYDSASGLDNIIADEEQYQMIYENEGAQFIQNLLGTRTLVFVGCGQTTDDINIGRFIRFAREHLKLDVPYYFLCRDGETVPKMPDHIRVIPYGTDYGDLPDFLEDMVQARLRAFMDRHPLVGRTIYYKEKVCSSGLQGYHYAQEKIPFSGRRKELEDLERFLDQEQDLSWWAVTGQAGAGKSRLALELLKRTQNEWFGFFVNDRATEKDAKEYVPFGDNLVFIDYVQGREQETARIVQALMDSFGEKKRRLRILFLEREQETKEGSWYARLSSQFGKYEKERFIQSEYHPSDLSGDRGGSHAFLCLDDLEPQDVESFIGDVCKVHGFPADAARNRMLYTEYGKRFERLRYRPLFVQIYVEAWIANGCVLPRYDSFENLLEKVLEKEQERWLSLLDGDQKLCNALVRLLVRACAGGGLDISRIPELYREDWKQLKDHIRENTFAGRQRQENLEMLLKDVCQSVGDDENIINPLYPDLLKEYMFAYYTDPEELIPVASELWENEGRAFSEFMNRCLTDFPGHESFRIIMNQSPGCTTDIHILAARLALLKKRSIRPEDAPEKLHRQIDEEYLFWHNVPLDAAETEESLKIAKFSGLMMVARQYGGWVTDKTDRVMSVIEEALEIPGGEGLHMLKCFSLGEWINEFSKAGFLEEAGVLREKLTRINQDGSTAGIGALVNLQSQNADMMECLLYGEFKEAYEVLEKMIRDCNMGNIEEVKMLALSCLNMTRMGSMQQKPEYIQKSQMQLEKLYQRYPDSSAICARCLNGRMQDIQYRFFSRKRSFKKDAAILREVEKVEQEINARKMDQQLSEVWAAVQIFRLNFQGKEEAAVRTTIQNAEKLLEDIPGADGAAQAYICAVHMLHKNILQNKVSSEEVEKAYAYLERFADSESVRELFFDMLKDSEEAGNRARYLNQRILSEAIQDARMNPMNPCGVEEVEELFGG